MASTNNLFGLEHMEVDTSVDATFIFEEINKELEEYLLEKQSNNDSTDSVFDFLESLTNRVHEDFDELIGEDNNKKRFVKALTRIFALLLNTKVNTAYKIKRIIKTDVGTTSKIWHGPK